MSRAQWLLWSACVGAELAALVLAVVVARRDRAHRPVAALFALAVVADVVVRLGQALVLEGAPKPFVGLARAVYHVETALVTAWPAGCAALAWWAFTGKAKGPRGAVPASPESDEARSSSHGEAEPRAVGTQGAVGSLAVKLLFAAWLAFSVGMAAAFPLPKGLTQPVLHGAHVACAALAGLAIMLGWRRRRERPAQVAAWLFATQTAIAIVGPFARAPFEHDGWDVARWVYLTIFALLAARHAFWLRSRQ